MLLSHTVNRKYHPPRSAVGMCPQERKQRLADGYPGASKQVQGALGRRGRCPSPPISFLFPKAILGRRRCEDQSWDWREDLPWFSPLHLLDSVFACFTPSLPSWPPNKKNCPEKGRDTLKKDAPPSNLSWLLWLCSQQRLQEATPRGSLLEFGGEEKMR